MTLRLARTRPTSAVLGLFVAVVAVLAFAAPAHAHVGLASSDPSDGATLGTPPSSVTLVFTEPLSPERSVVALRVDGAPARPLEASGGPTLTALTVELPADADVPLDGALAQWSIDYRVVGDDGHPVEGSVGFSAPATALPAPGTSAPAERPGASAQDGPRIAPSSATWQRPAAVLVLSALTLLALVIAVARRVRS